MSIKTRTKELLLCGVILLHLVESDQRLKRRIGDPAPALSSRTNPSRQQIESPAESSTSALIGYVRGQSRSLLSRVDPVDRFVFYCRHWPIRDSDRLTELGK